MRLSEHPRIGPGNSQIELIEWDLEFHPCEMFDLVQFERKRTIPIPGDLGRGLAQFEINPHLEDHVLEGDLAHAPSIGPAADPEHDGLTWERVTGHDCRNYSIGSMSPKFPSGRWYTTLISSV